MRTTTLHLLLLLAFLLPSVANVAQNAHVRFSYDANGNRISRTIEVKKIEENGKNVEEENDFLALVKDRLGNAQVSVYPNPTEGKVTINMTEIPANGITATLTTVTGAVIGNCRFKGLQHDFDLTGQPAGVYLLRLVAGDETRTWKIVKQ